MDWIWRTQSSGFRRSELLRKYEVRISQPSDFVNLSRRTADYGRDGAHRLEILRRDLWLRNWESGNMIFPLICIDDIYVRLFDWICFASITFGQYVSIFYIMKSYVCKGIIRESYKCEGALRIIFKKVNFF